MRLGYVVETGHRTTVSTRGGPTLVASEHGGHNTGQDSPGTHVPGCSERGRVL